MTEIAKSMLKQAWDMNGPLNPMYWIHMGTELMKQMPQTPNPMRWLSMRGDLMKHLRQALPAELQPSPAPNRLTTSVLDRAFPILSDPPRGASISTPPVRPQGTGWGPMP